jgi:hypothetical protein
VYIYGAVFLAYNLHATSMNTCHFHSYNCVHDLKQVCIKILKVMYWNTRTSTVTTAQDSNFQIYIVYQFNEFDYKKFRYLAGSFYHSI